MRDVRAALAMIALVACKDAPSAPDPRAACVAALAAPRDGLDGGLGALLDRCTPCGVSWAPLVAISAFSPDEPPADPPDPDAILGVLDACRATCTGTARTEVADLLRNATRAPAAPWRKLAERCDGAMPVDDASRRFARGTWYALDRIARAVPESHGAEFPLPPLSEASTALALPRADRLAAWAPTALVTVTADRATPGVLPRVRLTPEGARAVAPAVPVDAPVTLVAPRGLRVARVVEVVETLSAPPYLAATPRRNPAPWPEPVGAIPVALARSTDAAAPPLVLPATATVADLAAALERLDPGVAAVRVTLDPTTSP